MKITTNYRALVAVGILVSVGSYVGAGPGPAGPPIQDATTRQAAPTFGGLYTTVDARRRALIDDWVARLREVTGQKIEAKEFYDTVIKLSAKTTFEAITHALMTTALTDESGKSLGDALDLVEHVDTVRGQGLGDASDHQFRMYVRLKESAQGTLALSRQFKRGRDNTVYHKGYPVSYRGQGGTPSIQISIALDGRRADVDVDYRSSIFPASMLNGHLTAANSDVRAGNNHDRHIERWTGFQNWWGNFFGIRLASPDDAERSESSDTRSPRVGSKDADVMMEDFLKAWLLEGDIRAAISYISPRAHACMAEDSADPASFDRGMAPFVLARRLKVAHDTLGPRTSLADVTVGVRLTRPGLRLVTQPHHAQFVLYAVPDDVAVVFDCQSRVSLAAPDRARRTYGNYFAATFFIKGPGTPTTVALLWARERDYWRIVSWRTEPEGDANMPAIVPPATAAPRRIAADATLVQAAHQFLDSWLVRKEYDRAFNYLSPKSYSCYDLTRPADQPAAASVEDAGRRIRAAIERAGTEIGKVRDLDSVVTAAEPFHPALRVMDHRYARTFALSSMPNALADAADCATRVRGAAPASDPPPEYGTAFELTVRFRTQAGDAAVLRTMWVKESDAWRITVYAVDVP